MQVSIINQKNNFKQPNFKGCDISKLNKSILKEHIEWDSLLSQKDVLASDVEINNKVETLWQKILEIYNKHKDNKKIKIEISSFKDHFGEHRNGYIQAKIGPETSNLSEKVVSSISNFNLAEKIDEEVRSYSYLSKDK